MVLQNLISSTADVSLADIYAEHMLLEQDTYFRFCPSGDVFNCDLGTNDEDIVRELRAEAEAYMACPSVRDKVRRTVERLRSVMDDN